MTNRVQQVIRGLKVTSHSLSKYHVLNWSFAVAGPGAEESMDDVESIVTSKRRGRPPQNAANAKGDTKESSTKAKGAPKTKATSKTSAKSAPKKKPATRTKTTRNTKVVAKSDAANVAVADEATVARNDQDEGTTGSVVSDDSAAPISKDLSEDLTELEDE